MPISFGYSYENLGPLREAWTEHYIRKGCHPVKAKRVADERLYRGKRTWPPATVH